MLGSPSCSDARSRPIRRKGWDGRDDCGFLRCHDPGADLRLMVREAKSDLDIRRGRIASRFFEEWL
jgi:hypothetical protein